MFECAGCFLAHFSLRGGFLVRNLAALKTRLVKPVNLRLHPQPFHAFRCRIITALMLIYAAKCLRVAVAPVCACVKSIENRRYCRATTIRKQSCNMQLRRAESSGEFLIEGNEIMGEFRCAFLERLVKPDETHCVNKNIKCKVITFDIPIIQLFVVGYKSPKILR
jgi:hypothetical protein